MKFRKFFSEIFEAKSLNVGIGLLLNVVKC